MSTNYNANIGYDAVIPYNGQTVSAGRRKLRLHGYIRKMRLHGYIRKLIDRG